MIFPSLAWENQAVVYDVYLRGFIHSTDQQARENPANGIESRINIKIISGKRKNEKENFKLVASGEKSNKEKPVKTSGQNKKQNNPIFFSSS